MHGKVSMNMSKGLTMNNIPLTKVLANKKPLALAFTVLFISACADSKIVTIDAPAEQVHNLHDFDSDGVIKAREKCDGTTLGALIDNNGCGIKTSQVDPFLIDIKFENNSYTIAPFAYAEIKNLAEFLKKHSELNLLIEGHTSKVGSESLNQTLSTKRAEAVALVLINDFNIDKNRVSSKGYGFERLAVAGDNEQAHAANRRIMAELSYTQQVEELKWTIYTVDETN